MKKKTMLKTILTLLTCSLVMVSCNSGNTVETSENTSSAVSVQNSESELSSEQSESSAESDSQEEEQGFVLAYPEHMQSMGFTESLELEKEPETIVCLSTYPVQTLMGMGVELAAVPTTKVIEYPADYSGTILPAIMNDNFDLEQVIAMEPDLVILPNSAQEKYGATLESLEIPVYYIAMTSSGFSAYDVIRQQTVAFTEAFGTDTDKQTKGKEILSRFDTLDAELAAFSEKTEGMSVFAITVCVGRQHSLLSPLDCLPAKTGGAAGGGAYAPFILTARWFGWLCYCSYEHNSRKQHPISPSMQIDLFCISSGQCASDRFTQA